MKITPLTFGQARFHKTHRQLIKWTSKILEFSEKQDSVFWDIDGELFCSFVEDDIPFLELMNLQKVEGEKFFVYRLGIESMTIIKMEKTYNDGIYSLKDARMHFRNRELTSKFLSKSIINIKNQSK